MPENFTFAEYLKSYRTRAGISQQDFAETLRTTYSIKASRTTVSNWERGEFLPRDRGVILAISEALYLTPEERNTLLLSAEYASDLTEIPRSQPSEMHGRINFSLLYPPCPSLLLGRSQDMAALKQRLLPSDQEARVHVLTAVHGWPGVGKSTLAAALAYDESINQMFPDGVLWASVGEQPKVMSTLRAWGRTLNIPMLEAVQTIEELTALLAEHLRYRRCLLILDDIWDVVSITPFHVGGHMCAMLATTRLPVVAQTLAPTASHIYQLGVLSDEQGVELLRLLAPSVVRENEEQCRTLVSALEGLPLALQVAGRLLHVEATLGFGVTELLNDLQNEMIVLSASVPPQIGVDGGFVPTIAVLLQKSVARLDEQTRLCFVCLGGQAPKPATFDGMAMAHMWRRLVPGRWENHQVKRMISTLVGRGLLEPVGNGRFWMHAVLAAHARSYLLE